MLKVGDNCRISTKDPILDCFKGILVKIVSLRRTFSYDCEIMLLEDSGDLLIPKGSTVHAKLDQLVLVEPENNKEAISLLRR